MVRGRAEARWLPSRHRFALFRLHAYLRLRGAKPQPTDGLILAIHPDQSAFDTYAVALWTMATMTCFLYALLVQVMIAPAALLLAVPLASIVIQAPHAVGLIVRGGPNTGLISKILMLLFTVLSLHFARTATWVRFAAWQFLLLLALNALAALVMFALRGRVARLEESYGGAASAG
jgi:hypothetical protein